MAIVFPASPSVNDIFTEGSITYKWDGAKWIGLGITPADRLVEGSNKLEIDGSNNLIWTGGTSKFGGVLQGDQRVIINGAGGKTGTGNTLLNYAGDASTVTASLTADGFLVAGGGHFTDNLTPTSGRGVEIFAPSAGVGQIACFNRDNNGWDELNIKGSEVKIYSGTNNTLRFEVMTDRVKVHGTTDGVLELDTTDGRGSFIRFQENGTTKGWAGCSEGIGTGGDQDDFGIRAVGNIILRANGAERLRVSEDGEVTKPDQPLAVIGTNQNNWAPSAGDNLPFNVAETDIGSNYDTSTYKFTCPVAGNYMVILTHASTRWLGDLELRRDDIVVRTLELRAIGLNAAGAADWASRSYSFIIPCTVGQELHWRCSAVYTSIGSNPYLLDGQSTIGGQTVYTRYDSATYYLVG